MREANIIRKPQPGAAAGHCDHSSRRRVSVILALLLLPLVLGGWRSSINGETINPRFVERIVDGKTTKNEILVMFGEPQESKRTPDGQIFTYKSFKDAPALMPYRPEDRKINPQSESRYLIDDNKQVKKATIKKEGKVLRSTLVIRFKPDGDTVLSHEYQTF